MLECSCGEVDINDHAWIWYQPSDFSVLTASRRKRCTSCKELINQKSTVVKFNRFRAPNSEIEERCKGDEIELAPYYMCEKCGEIFFNLSAVGYCLDIQQCMSAYMVEYHKMVNDES